MAYMSSPSVILGESPSAEHLAMLKAFTRANGLPQVLLTHNSTMMQKAFMSVSQYTWMSRIEDLQVALKVKNASESVRRMLVTARKCEQLPHINQLLDRAFLEKYDELTSKIKFDYDGFFPYRITKMNKDLLVFEKLQYAELVTYILSNPI